MGRSAEARDAIERIRAAGSEPMAASFAFLRNPEHRRFYLSGLRLAAGEMT
jgi:hypothetical protein